MMAIVQEALAHPNARTVGSAIELGCDASVAFDLITRVAKWPVWLSFLRSAEIVGPEEQLQADSEVVVRSSIPGERDQLFEVEHFSPAYRLSLVGAYSVRRRLDFRIEQKTSRCKLHVRVEYPAYGGKLGAIYDALAVGRRLSSQLGESLQHFKGLAEFETHKDAVLEDF